MDATQSGWSSGRNFNGSTVTQSIPFKRKRNRKNIKTRGGKREKNKLKWKKDKTGSS
jgi:hypothetical protein